MDEMIVDLNDFADGALAERFNYELKNLLQNIADPNTDPKKKRKLQIVLTLTSNEKREIAEVDIDVKTTPAPRLSLGSTLVMDRDEAGYATAAELKSGMKDQTYFDSEDGRIKDDRGGVIDFKAQGGNK
ncbi:hypothetical protein SAMN05421839_10640 [Halolactibacillus halophilus]|uniref:Replication terminator protein n=1 Tax=Halolactibacillus halophilus TaxID=306540 RepID=A0A1I5MR40_9BACI|nr:replication terminator protein [Halolactibacillus halophilus]GEM02885.1 hypothetical protein HHA03_24170 [Halolactibacillus halophilus]SFP11416.1 hypothetical protein SAMN05421839_10640 [Halolactibacillus halophilus]